MDIPNLGGFADPNNVSKKTGSFSASYINWARTLHDIREHASGWMPEMVEDCHGEQMHKAPDGSKYLMIRFRHTDGTETTCIPHAIMDNKMKSLRGDTISSRDLSDSFVRGACKCAAAVFGYAWEMWSKDDPMERTKEEDDAIADERRAVKEGSIKQSNAQAEQTEDEILYVGNDIVDQHSTPQGWREENDPISVQDSVQEDHWSEFVCPFPKHKGKKLGVVAEEDPSYLGWMCGTIDTIENERLVKALNEYSKVVNNNGLQGFKRVS